MQTIPSAALVLPPPRSFAVFQHNHPAFATAETDLMVRLTQQRSGLASARSREAKGRNRPDRLAMIDAKIAINRQAILDHRDAVELRGWRRSKFQAI